MAVLQVAELRQALDTAAASQVVYIEVDHWTDFPHAGWGLLNQDEQRRLDKHFRRCYAVGPYIKGAKQLPPTVPGRGAYDHV